MFCDKKMFAHLIHTVWRVIPLAVLFVVQALWVSMFHFSVISSFTDSDCWLLAFHHRPRMNAGFGYPDELMVVCLVFTQPRKNFVFDNKMRERLAGLLIRYQGTHSFHNFTVKVFGGFLLSASDRYSNSTDLPPFHGSPA